MGGKISQRARAMYAAVKIKSVNLLKFDRRRNGATSGNFFAAGAKASDGLETILLWFLLIGKSTRDHQVGHLGL